MLNVSERTHEPLPDAQISSGRCVLWLVGSSSVHRWTSADTQLESWQIHNRGIEAARLPELQQRVIRTAQDVAPAAIVLYAGENDLADGVAEASVASGLEKLAVTLALQAPEAIIFLVSMKPSPNRWGNRLAQLAVDARLRRFTATRRNMKFVDAGRTCPPPVMRSGETRSNDNWIKVLTLTPSGAAGRDLRAKDECARIEGNSATPDGIQVGGAHCRP